MHTDCLNKAIPAIFTSSIFSVNSSTKGWGERVLHCWMLHATKLDIDVQLCSIHLPPM